MSLCVIFIPLIEYLVIMSVKVGIVGFRGYSGKELVCILGRHAEAEPVLLEHRADAAERPVPRGERGPARLPSTAEAVKAEGLAVVFLATPPEVSMELTPDILTAGAKVVDLSGAFRLGTPENYKRWYKAEHTQPESAGFLSRVKSFLEGLGNRDSYSE